MPSSNLNIAVVPVDMIPGDSKANIDYISGKIATLPSSTDLIVVPEMCNTGFSVDKELVGKFAETAAGYSMSRIREIAVNNNVAIWGTMAIAEGDKLFNRGFMIDNSGHTRFYDKRHLFVLGEEPELYTPGNDEAPVVELKGWKLKMSICYDLRFPVWNRWTKSTPYDALIVPANWPAKREYAWRSLLIARAIENQAYVIGCNRLGSDPYGTYSPELSFVFDCWGNETGHRNLPDGIVTATLDGPMIDHARSRFPNLGAADDFSITV
ncbi:MAG: hypothetical protein HDR92_07265 [Bacteroides sp.]|nr:hypothetical protein [Bacteroides sp.]